LAKFHRQQSSAVVCSRLQASAEDNISVKKINTNNNCRYCASPTTEFTVLLFITSHHGVWSDSKVYLLLFFLVREQKQKENVGERSFDEPFTGAKGVITNEVMTQM
jgi:hypothetical protein